MKEKNAFQAVLTGLHSCLAVAFIALSLPAQAAVTAVPGVLSAPVVLYDDGGNLLPDGDYGVTVILRSADGEVLFQERHEASVVNGVTALNIGSGQDPDSGESSGGLSREIFTQSDEVTVEIAVDGFSTARETAVLGSQPYAFVSDYALSLAPDAVTGLAIKDGTVTAADLEPSFLASLAAELSQAPEAVEGASAAAVLSAESVILSESTPLQNSSAATVEGVLRDLDAAISSLLDLELATLLDALDEKLAAHVESFAGVHGIIGDVVGTSDAQALANKSLDATNAISATAIKSGTLSEIFLDAELARDSELAFSNLSGVAAETQIPEAIARDSELVFSNLSGVAAVTQIPEAIARDSELAFSNLSGVAAETQIPEAVTRDSELAFSNLSGVISANQIPTPNKPFAYGTLSRPSGGTCTGYNMDTDCTFTTNTLNTGYVVVLTSQTAATCTSSVGVCGVTGKTVSSFTVACQCPGGGSSNPQVDFAVFTE